MKHWSHYVIFRYGGMRSSLKQYWLLMFLPCIVIDCILRHFSKYPVSLAMFPDVKLPQVSNTVKDIQNSTISSKNIGPFEVSYIEMAIHSFYCLYFVGSIVNLLCIYCCYMIVSFWFHRGCMFYCLYVKRSRILTNFY